MLNKTEAAQLMIDDLPCRESLGADDVDYSALITAWNKKKQKKQARWKHCESGCALRPVGQLVSLFLSFFFSVNKRGTKAAP